MLLLLPVHIRDAGGAAAVVWLCYCNAMKIRTLLTHTSVDKSPPNLVKTPLQTHTPNTHTHTHMLAEGAALRRAGLGKLG